MAGRHISRSMRTHILVILHTDVVLGEGLLVHFLIHAVFGREEGAQAGRVYRIKARRQSKSLPHTPGEKKSMGVVIFILQQ